MSDRDSVQNALIALFANKLHVDVAAPDTDLVEAGVLDSLAFVTLLLHLEEGFGVQVPMDLLDLEHFRSIEHIAAFVVERKAKAAA
jgi:acyl carrier protein